MQLTNEIQMVLGISISIATIVTIFASAVRWLVKHYFDDIKKELQPNSGSSMKDQVTRLESKTDKLEGKIDKLYEILIKQ
jgi:chaperonin cofactor prefoldin